MLYGRIKLAEEENFYREHEGAIEGSLRGILTGGIVGAMKDHKERATTWQERTKNGLIGGAVGGISGGIMGHYIDNNRPSIEAAVNKLFIRK